MGHSEMLTLMKKVRPVRTELFVWTRPPSCGNALGLLAFWQPPTDTEKSDRVSFARGRLWALRQLINFHLLAKPLLFSVKCTQILTLLPLACNDIGIIFSCFVGDI